MGQTISIAEARRFSTDTPAAEYLDAATVVAAARSHVEVELIGGRRVDAKLALAMPYQPAIGDELLVIGSHKGYWVIGVVSGTGSLDLHMPGDINIHSMNGKLRLGADRGVDINSDVITLHAKAMRVTADKVVEQFTNVVRNVREMLSVRAGQRHTIVEGNSLETAKRIAIYGKENVAVNGQQIHLG